MQVTDRCSVVVMNVSADRESKVVGMVAVESFQLAEVPRSFLVRVSDSS